MNKELIELLAKRPKEYEVGEEKFWDDEHISKEMLRVHLAPEVEAASRKHKFIDDSVEWLTSLLGGGEGKQLLDLGCGPGMYTQRLAEKGFKVTGVDFSKRSIAYAKETAKKQGKDIAYYYQDYRTIDFKEQFDMIILIYCDFGVLSPGDRALLLKKIFQALKPEGIFVFDGWTKEEYKNFHETQTITYEKEGFWRPYPYINIHRQLRYEKEQSFLDQDIIITKECLTCYNIWNCAFTKEDVSTQLKEMGFNEVAIYGDASGSSYSENSKTLCAVARKA